MTLRPPPDCRRLLEALRLRAVDRQRRGGAGHHLVRRRGQSLEFREFLPYQPGMDVRHIDWRASYRYGKPDDWLVKTFVAEEDITLVISIDSRPGMWLPEAAPKIQLATWLAWAIGTIGLQTGDRIILHRLFGPPAQGLREFRGTLAADGLWPSLTRLFPGPEPGDRPNLAGLDRYLPPTSAWLVLSDFYFPDTPDTRRLAAALTRARDGARWVVPGDLDSWPHETALLGHGARRVEGPGTSEDGIECDVQTRSLASIESEIHDHKQAFFQRAHASGERLHWSWPAQPRLDPESLFKQQLARDPLLEKLFLRRGTA